MDWQKIYCYIKWVIFQNHILIVITKKVEFDLSNYPTNSDLKKPTRVETSDFPKKADLATFKSNIDKLDID